MNISDVIPVFQPIHHLASDEIAWEMLARIPSTPGGLESAFPLIEMLESRGECYLLDQAQLGRAIDHLERYPKETIFINIFPSSLLHKSTWALFAEHLESLKNPNRLIIELTERDPGLLEAVPFARLLADDFGIRLALDDFGSGASGMSVLLSAPFDFVKIDAHFYHQLIKNNTNAGQFISVMNQLCKSGQHASHTILEGVEDMDWVHRIRDLGFDYAQGFALGRPQEIPIQYPTGPIDPLIEL